MYKIVLCYIDNFLVFKMDDFIGKL